MKKFQIIICFVLLFVMGFSAHAEVNDGSQWFVYELLKFYVPSDVEQQYRAENRIHFSYRTDGEDPKEFMKVSNMALDEYGRPFFLVSFTIKPTWQEGVVVLPDYYDRVTYQVYPALLRQYGESKGIKRFKYEKKYRTNGCICYTEGSFPFGGAVFFVFGLFRYRESSVN